MTEQGKGREGGEMDRTSRTQSYSTAALTEQGTAVYRKRRGGEVDVVTKLKNESMKRINRYHF